MILSHTKAPLPFIYFQIFSTLLFTSCCEDIIGPTNGLVYDERNISRNEGLSSSSRVSVDNSGNIHVTWNDEADGEWQIYYRERSSNGEWGEIVDLNEAEYSSIAPDIITDNNDNIHVVWEEQADNGIAILHKERKDIVEDTIYNWYKYHADFKSEIVGSVESSNTSLPSKSILKEKLGKNIGKLGIGIRVGKRTLNNVNYLIGIYIEKGLFSMFNLEVSIEKTLNDIYWVGVMTLKPVERVRFAIYPGAGFGGPDRYAGIYLLLGAEYFITQSITVKAETRGTISSVSPLYSSYQIYSGITYFISL